MIYSLVLVTALGVQSIGSYDNLAECQSAARDFQKQKVPASCVRQESPEQAMNRATAIMKNMMEQINATKNY